MTKVRPLPQHLAEVAKNELQEEPERLEGDLQHLKEWLAKQPHLKARTDDQFLVAFLRGCKFSLERAKEKLDAYYMLRNALPEFFNNRDPSAPDVSSIMKHGAFLPLGVDAEGRRVLLLRAGGHDPARLRVADVFRLAMLLADALMLEDDPLAVRGQVGVVDLADVTLGHAAQYSPALIKRVLTYFQDGMPLRPKGIHYLNMKPAVETIVNIFKSFMKEKLKKRISIHPDLSSLYNSVPKSILPEEYGGDAGPLQEIADAWAKKLEMWKQRFEEDAQFGVDESKRPGKPKTHEDLFGMEGSFRQLSVD